MRALRAACHQRKRKGGDEVILVDTGLEEFMVPDHVGEKYGLRILEFEDALADILIPVHDPAVGRKTRIP